jgi:hypothetical protein
VSLLGVGKYERGDLSFQVDFQQLNWAGHIGVFFGFQPGGGNVANPGDFQVLELQVLKTGELLLARHHFTFRSESPYYQNVRTLVRMPINVLRDDWNALEFRIQDGKLVNILFNGADFSGLVQHPKTLVENSYCKGRFGVYNARSAGVFSGFQIDNQPLRLRPAK